MALWQHGCRAERGRIRNVYQPITSKANPRVRALRTALAGRADGVIGIEGLHLLHEALRSGLRVQTLAVRQDRAALLETLSTDGIAEVLLLSHEAFGSAACTEHAQGVAAILPVPESAYAARSGDLVVVADGLQDPGNLGTLIRSAEAFGAAAVAMTANTVNPWNGKCLRAAAGAAFRVALPAWNDSLLHSLRQVDARLYAAVAHGGTFAHRANLTGTRVLVVGNEAAGVSQALLQVCDERLTLATPGPTESLNAAVAGSLLLYEASQQRLQALA